MKIIHRQQKNEISDTLENLTCKSCGMTQDQWKGNFGKGYSHGSEVYCCLGCADGDGCGCGNF